VSLSSQRRLLYVPVFHIDANLINARQKLPAVNQLEQWDKDGVILLNMSGTAHKEAHAGSKVQRSRKANQQIRTMTPEVSEHDSLYGQVEAALLHDGAKTKNQMNDISIVCEAAKYNAILITNDGGSKSQPGGMLGNRHKLTDFVKIMSPDEAIDFVRSKIIERDEFNRHVAKEFGHDLPPWTGTDYSDA